jgi:hypothetical protein
VEPRSEGVGVADQIDPVSAGADLQHSAADAGDRADPVELGPGDATRGHAGGNSLPADHLGGGDRQAVWPGNEPLP